VRTPEGCVDPGGRDVLEPCALEALVDRARPAQAEQSPGLVRIARGQASMLEGGRHQDRDARVRLRRGEHHGALAATGFERAMHLAQTPGRIGEAHQPKPAHRCVEARFLD
jgi:hypothetical protein